MKAKNYMSTKENTKLQLAFLDGIKKGGLTERKRIIEWGNERCNKHYVRSPLVADRRNCGKCWAELEKEVQKK